MTNEDPELTPEEREELNFWQSLKEEIGLTRT